LNRRRQRPVAKQAEELVVQIHSLDEWNEKINRNKLVVVHFATVWCPASRKMAPVFSDLAKKFRNVVFLKVDVEADKMGTIAKSFNVEGVPTFLFIRGGDDVDRVVGADKEELEEKLEEQVY
jgi:thiol-disulfide isomerase/thioredoxin